MNNEIEEKLNELKKRDKVFVAIYAGGRLILSAKSNSFYWQYNKKTPFQTLYFDYFPLYIRDGDKVEIDLHLSEIRVIYN